MRSPLVSVIVPCYNVEHYIDECLITLTNQTLKDIEIICVDDCSTDGTSNILLEWAKNDCRIIVIRHEKNKGVGSARNTGIRMAKADYVAFVDSDDFVATDKYECLYSLSQGGEIDLIVSSQHYLYGETESVTNQIPNTLTNIDDIRRHVLIHGFSIWKSIVKKYIIFNNNLFFPDRLCYEDAPVSTCLFLCSNSIACYSDKPLHYYRINNSSSITKTKGNMNYFDRLETAVLFYHNTKRLNVYTKYKDEIEYAFFHLFYENTILGATKKFSPLPYKTIKTIPARYKETTSHNIKNNPIYRINKAPGIVFATAYYPELLWLWRPLYSIWSKISARIKDFKKSHNSYCSFYTSFYQMR